MGFNCTTCGEYYDTDDEWNDNDICNACYKKKFATFKKERQLGHDYKKWLNQNK